MCSGPIKFLTKAVWLSGHNPCVRLRFVVCRSLSLSAPSRETGSEAKAAAHAEGGLISLIDLHYRGYTLRARMSLRLCADLMPNISPQNQRTRPHENCLCVCVRHSASLLYALNLPVYPPPRAPPSACLTLSISFFLLRQLALCWSLHVQLLNPSSLPVKF